jgi:hypothetical protein
MAGAVLPQDPRHEVHVARHEHLVGGVELADVVVLVAARVPAVAGSEQRPEPELAEDLRDLGWTCSSMTIVGRRFFGTAMIVRRQVGERARALLQRRVP